MIASDGQTQHSGKAVMTLLYYVHADSIKVLQDCLTVGDRDTGIRYCSADTQRLGPRSFFNLILFIRAIPNPVQKQSKGDFHKAPVGVNSILQAT